ncbi:MAG: penicillin acylase family protein [Nibricoccus sp.]
MPAAKRRSFKKILSGILVVAVLTIALSSAWFYWQLKRSVPLLDGELALSSAGLTAPVTIERDAQGVPTLHAASRADAARALGFLHAQDRFFQMDLSRRRAAGELAELVGEGALPLDRAARIHDFRTVARATFSQLPPNEQALLNAYAAGVNAGLAQLSARPFEYIVLRGQPAPWKPEDSILVAHAMWLDLQDGDGAYERSLAALRDTLGLAAANFFAPLIAPDDAAFDGTTAELPAIPGPRILDLRRSTASSTGNFKPSSELLAAQYAHLATPAPREGSNSLAVSGKHTVSGSALLANDMHLSLRVPNTWYRASLVFRDAQKTEHRVTGVTLPGTPFIIAGSNGHIAWGFTNSNTDTVDTVAIAASDIDRSFYLHEGKTLEFTERLETIRVHGGDPVIHKILLSPWGPVIGSNAKGQHLALKWIAHDPAATNFTLGELETATTTAQAIAIAHRSGIPAQNFLVADSTGTIAWTLAGKLPRRVGFDGRFPVTMSYGDRRWDGFVPENQIPVLSSDSSLSTSDLQSSAPDRLSTANQRLIGGGDLTLLGDGGYEPPLRAARIQQLLAPLDKAAPRDLLAIQLDDHAPHLERWHQLLVRTLADEVRVSAKTREALSPALEPWTGRATIDSTSYRLVHNFRLHVTTRTLVPIFARTLDKYPDFNFSRLRYEPALWRLLEEKPQHLLDPTYLTWEDLLAAAASDLITDDGGPRTTWGEQNTAGIRHPLSRILPGFLARRLDMPADPLPGDKNLPRVQTPNHGASERFSVSPGHEAEGIFHMPGGQSGHPLSPFYRAGHDAWVKGEPTPFLPGQAQHTLTLTP